MVPDSEKSREKIIVVVLAFLGIWFSAAVANATTYNVPNGFQEGLRANSGIAAMGSPSLAVFNPAGVHSPNSKSSISASSTLISSQKIIMEGSFGFMGSQSNDEISSRTQPGLILSTNKINDASTWGFFISNDQDYNFIISFQQSTATDTSASMLSFRGSLLSLGLLYSAWTSSVAWGLSLSVLNKEEEQLWLFKSSAAGQFSSIFSRTKGVSQHLKLNTGFIFPLNDSVNLGMSYSPQCLRLQARESVFSFTSSTGGSAYDSSDSSEPAVIVPAQARAGAKVSFEKTNLYLDLAQEFPASFNRSSGYAEDLPKSNTVSLGFDHVLTTTFKLFSGLAFLKEDRPGDPQQTLVTLGTSRIIESATFNLGGYLANATQKESKTGTNTSPGSTVQTLGIMVSSAFSF